MIHSILCVCTGNICRSPLAEALLRDAAPDLQVASAGVAALVGEPAEANAIALAEEHGLDLSAHRARQLDADLIREYELVLTMEQAHTQWITQVFPQARGRVHLLGRWQDNQDVPDPYRRSLEYFRYVFRDIERFCGDWTQRLAA